MTDIVETRLLMAQENGVRAVGIEDLRLVIFELLKAEARAVLAGKLEPAPGLEGQVKRRERDIPISAGAGFAAMISAFPAAPQCLVMLPGWITQSDTEALALIAAAYRAREAWRAVQQPPERPACSG